ncbi:phosphomannose isomerase GDP mannose pyrophosphorylase (plasmid) [Legionella adelaidensis]|uniref:mannose-1-phosphate guanylyltransferase n=1 Tax=Legionella adelaidensis TaxID=45056 RepID=A0A0W0R173_9GAMM|nr:mannose-1-phosphate guanylyltransferase/mannose-6-phosphate isomerase [Legionella adelaidensis]KTC64844.1 phosphomannose isomerase GDP mannose pyrophosphorylase [Legionella adelaidensis]VEH82985.1 phosphomannose isomerase GDP mannose pyrophosphorylase [Legionella adelaidensis]
MPSKIFPIILAGGSGTRLWPLSRKSFPKQFLRLQGQSSLLQQTVERAALLNVENLLIVSNEAHYFLCQEQLEAFSLDIHYLLEPCARNTAPAIAAAAHYIAREAGEEAILMILPSDHWFADSQAWSAAMQEAVEYAKKHSALVTFGIKPTSAKTGYGYIETEAVTGTAISPVRNFCEKPNEQTAHEFLAKGNYFWNSGMFVCKAGTYLAELKKFHSSMHQYAEEAVTNGDFHHDYFRLNAEYFAQCQDLSIDYAVMEKTDKAVMLPLNMQWSDLGCWTAVAEANITDEQGNAVHGKVIAKDSHDCLISSEDILVTTLGIRDQIIVATSDAVLVADKRYSQQVKEIVGSLGKEHQQLANEHLRVPRPWGFYEILAEGPTFKVKRLMIKPQAKISLQTHRFRAEHWVVVEGVAEVIKDEECLQLHANQSTYIPPNTKHRLSNMGDVPLFVIEVQSGTYLGEDDIVRFDDIYQRDNLLAPIR